MSAAFIGKVASDSRGFATHDGRHILSYSVRCIRIEGIPGHLWPSSGDGSATHNVGFA